jgi:Fe-S oxidoreductase
VELLEQAGFHVQLAGICCGRALLSKGFLTDARILAQEGIAKLDRFAAAGVPILGLEPSCLLALVDEWPELMPGSAAKRVAAASELAEGWLARCWQDQALATRDSSARRELSAATIARAVSDNGSALDASPRTAFFHGHCHQKALVGIAGSVNALKFATGLEVKVLDAGCCGMAGSFGYEKEHYDVSVAIANLALIPSLNADPQATVIATGTSCRHQIRDLTGRAALHPLEVLAGTGG